MEVNALSVVVVLLSFYYLSSGLAESKKMQNVVAIDVKPSGQVAHESVKLVREGTSGDMFCCFAGGVLLYVLLPTIQENGVTCVFTHAAVGGTNEVTMSYYNSTACILSQLTSNSYIMAEMEHDSDKDWETYLCLYN